MAVTHYGYYVLSEHTLGYLYKAGDSLFLGVLHGSILRGSNYDWRNGPVLIYKGWPLRKAMPADFDTYRVALPSDFNQYNNE